MSFSPAELDQVLAELSSLKDARLQKVAQPGPLLVVLELRVPGRTVLLQLCGAPGEGRLTVVDARPPSPPKPFALQGLLRARLTGAQLVGFERPGPTAAAVVFAAPGGRFTLVVEWDARGGDLALLDAEGRLLHAAGDRLRGRNITRGALYRAPGAGGAGPPAPTASAPAPPDDDVPFAASRRFEARYREGGARDPGAEASARLLAPLKRQLQRLERTREAVQGDRAKAVDAERLRRFGELLKPHLSRLGRGLSEAMVVDWTAEGPVDVRVPLLPQLSARENVARYFHQHRRLTEALGRIEARLAGVEERVSRCRSLLREAAAAGETANASAVIAIARAEGLLSETAPGRASGAPAAPRLPYREFTGAEGRRFWVGRGARDNDALTFRLGRGNDLWLHARGLVGAHVVVPGQGAGEPSDGLLLDAATLAAHFSGARGEPVVDVAWTRCRHVRRRKDGPPGAVLYTHDRTLVVRVEPERLGRLLATETARS
jgi:predicted ribosome quality control (RQC) complex YloA/Tae2 family protein